VGEGDGLQALQLAWKEVYKEELSQELLAQFIHKDLGEIVLIGENRYNQAVYWVAAGHSKDIMIQGWADLWPLLNDSITNWEVIES